jgi:large subunit ribosomal protein L7A
VNKKIQGKKAVGVKQTLKVIKSGIAKTVYIARDAEVKVVKPIEDLCSQNNIEIIHVDTMKELGSMCGIDVGAATAAMIDE